MLKKTESRFVVLLYGDDDGFQSNTRYYFKTLQDADAFCNGESVVDYNGNTVCKTYYEYAISVSEIADYNFESSITESTKDNSTDWNYNIDSCPVNVVVWFLSENHGYFLGTAIKKENGELTRGECFFGDPEWFYRDKFIAWTTY